MLACFKEETISKIVLAGTVTSPGSMTSIGIDLITPISKFVAAIFSLDPSVESKILSKTGSVDLTPTDLETVCSMGSKSCCNSDIFINDLFGRIQTLELHPQLLLS